METKNKKMLKKRNMRPIFGFVRVLWGLCGGGVPLSEGWNI